MVSVGPRAGLCADIPPGKEKHVPETNPLQERPVTDPKPLQESPVPDYEVADTSWTVRPEDTIPLQDSPVLNGE